MKVNCESFKELLWRENMKKMKKFLPILLIALIAMFSLSACGSKSEKSKEASEKASTEATVDKDAGTVSIDCVVNGAVKSPKHWFIVNKDGSMAKKSILNTAVTTDDFYKALTEVAGEKVWNDTDTEFGEDQSIQDLLKEGTGHSDFAKFKVTVSWGGKDYDLKDVITDPTYKGKAYDGSYEIGFSGNLENQRSAKTGCITCFGGCYMGITSGFDTPMMIEYKPANLPDDGETVKVTYTLVK